MLTEEQKKRIEENKRKALEKRKQKECINILSSTASMQSKSSFNTFTIPLSPTSKKTLPATSYSPSFRKRPSEYNPNLELGNSPSTSTGAKKQSTSYSPAFKKKRIEVETVDQQKSAITAVTKNSAIQSAEKNYDQVNTRTDYIDFSPSISLCSKPKTSYSPAFKKTNIGSFMDGHSNVAKSCTPVVRSPEKPTTSYNPFQKKISTHQDSSIDLDLPKTVIDFISPKKIIPKPTTSYSPSFKKNRQGSLSSSPTTGKITYEPNESLSSSRRNIIHEIQLGDIPPYSLSSSSSSLAYSEIEDKKKRAELNRLKALEKLKNKQMSVASVQESVACTSQEISSSQETSSQKTSSQESKGKCTLTP